MKVQSRTWQVGWRLIVCGLLLFWICHTIFSSEAQSAWRNLGRDWTGLARSEQWRLAWTIGPRELGRTLTLVEPWALFLSWVFMGSTILLGVWRWRLVLRVHGLPLDFGRALEISLIAQFFNAFLLGSTGGDLIKAYYAARETHHKKTEAVVTVLADRLIGLFSMLAFAGLMMMFNLKFLLQYRELCVVVWAVLLMLLGCGALLGLAFWGGVSRAFPRARSWLRRLPRAAQLEVALAAFRQLGRDRAFLRRAFGLSLVLNVACVLQLMSLGIGLGLDVPVAVWFVVVPTIICISALPITPSGLGVRENLYVLTLAGAGLHVHPTQALSLSLLAFFGFLVWSLIGGVVYLVVRRHQHLDELTRPGGDTELVAPGPS